MKKKTKIGIIISIAVILILLSGWALFKRNIYVAVILAIVGILIYLFRENIYQLFK